MSTPQTNFFNSAIKNLFLIITFLAFSNFLFAQNLPQSVIDKINSEGTPSFNKIQKVMDDYWTSENVKDGYVVENGVKTKAAGWKLFKRWEYYWDQRVNQQTGEFPTTNSAIEYEKYLKDRNALNKTAYSESWTNLGTNSSGGGYAGIGRINCVAFHPTDANTFWVGSPSGGIWKTTNGGVSWTILNNNETVLGVSDIAVDNTNPNILYIATGDRDGGSLWSLGGGQNNDNNSIGVLKSTDGGATWNTTGFSYAASSIKKIYRLLIHPTNNQILLASTSDGIYKTTDGGTNWTLKSIVSSRFRDMQFKPGDPTIIYAGRVAGGGFTYVYKSTNTGESWTAKTISGITTHYTSQIRLAVSANDPTVVYVALQDGRVYKSTDSGESYAKVSTNDSQNMLGYYTNGTGTASQASYDLCIACSPSDVNTVFLGSICTWKSTDGGVTWSANTNWTSHPTYNISGVAEVHADKHMLAYQNSSTTLFEGNDGGIYKTANGGTSWTDLTNGIIISQIYRIGISQTDANVVLTGLQDNGAKKYIGALNTWVDVTGGDGMECIIDFNNATSYMYTTYVNGEIYRNSDGFSTFATTTISANIPGGQPAGYWVTPYIMDPTNAANLFAGYDKIWKTTNRGTSWTSASQQLSASAKLRSLAIAPSNTSVLYTADPTSMWKTTDGGATNWTAITLPGAPTSSITYIAVKNTDPNTVWITYGGYQTGEKVYQSTDGGTSWTNISTGLPNLPIMSIVQYKTATDRNVLFVGTDVGVYVKDENANGNAWVAYNTGLPNVVVTELEILYTGGTNKLRAGTYGRGLWETDIDAGLPVELSSFTGSYNNNYIILTWTTGSEINNYGFDIERKSRNNKTDEWTKIGFVNGNGNSNSPKNYFYEDKNISSGTYSYRLKQIDYNGQIKHSDVIEVFTKVAPTKYALDQNYPNPFNPATIIKYQLPKSGLVQLKIFNLLGSEVAVLVNEVKTEGEYSVNFDASNLPTGVYLYKLQSGNFVETKKLMLLK